MVGNSSLEVNATNGKERRSRRVLVGVLSGLGVLIVGLVVAVVVVVVKYDEINTVRTKGADGSVTALELNDQIIQKMLNEPGYDFSDAVDDFEDAIRESVGDLRISIIIYYAYFLEDNDYSLKYIIDMLEEANLEDVGDDKRLEFYFVLEDFYDKSGDSAKLEEIEQKIESLSPGEEISSDQFMNVEGGSND